MAHICKDILNVERCPRYSPKIFPRIPSHSSSTATISERNVLCRLVQNKAPLLPSLPLPSCKPNSTIASHPLRITLTRPSFFLLLGETHYHSFAWSFYTAKVILCRRRTHPTLDYTLGSTRISARTVQLTSSPTRHRSCVPKGHHVINQVAKGV